MGPEHDGGSRRPVAAPESVPKTTRPVLGSGAARLLAVQRSAGNRVACRMAEEAASAVRPSLSGAEVIRRFLAYRSGANTLNNLTPAPKDLIGKKKGLSTMADPADVLGDKAQIIETDNLGDRLTAVRNGGKKNSHVSILPANDQNDAALTEWSQAKGARAGDHDLSRAVQNARTGEWRKPK